MNYHLKKVFDDGELEAGSAIRNFRITAADGETYDKVSLAIPMDVSATHKGFLSVQNTAQGG